MGIVGGAIASVVCYSLHIGSGLSSSSSSSSSSNSVNSTHRFGEAKIIDIDENDLNDSIKSIWRIEIPAVNDRSGSDLLNVFGKIFTGSKFAHDGLLIETNSNKYFVCQTYPIQFKKCSSYEDAIDSIKSYWNINKNAVHNAKGQYLNDYITINEIKAIVEQLPNYYDLFIYNCQHFCSRILKSLEIYEI